MGYKLLVCGGRDFDDYDKVKLVLDKVHTEKKFISLIINGAASGADALSSRWALANSVPILEFPANWSGSDTDKPIMKTTANGHIYDVTAGMRRNADMLRKGRPDGVVAFAGGRGTANMIRLATEAGIVVQEFP